MQRIFAPTLVALLLSATHAYAATAAPTQAPGLGAAQPPVITGPIGLGPAAVAAPAEAGVPGVMVLGSAPFDVRFLLGGSAAGAVVVEKQGPDGVSRKHLSGVRYEPIVVEAVPATPLDAWIGAFLSSAPARKDGALMEGAIPPGQQLAFKNALLSDVTFPACDARGKDLGRIRATIAPELATTGTVQGAAAIAPKAKAWLAHNFAFSIPGLETQRVVRIEAGFLAVVADAADRVADRALDVEFGVGRHLADDDAQTFCDRRLAGNASITVLGQHAVEDGVGDLVGYFIRMAFSDGLRGKQKTIAQIRIPPH